MPTDTIPEPYHRWRANEDWDVRAFTAKDNCLSCKVPRMSRMSGTFAVRSNAVAAGPCPQRDWRELTDEEQKPYLLAYIDEARTPSEREMLRWAQS